MQDAGDEDLLGRSTVIDIVHSRESLLVAQRERARAILDEASEARGLARPRGGPRRRDGVGRRRPALGGLGGSPGRMGTDPGRVDPDGLPRL